LIISQRIVLLLHAEMLSSPLASRPKFSSSASCNTGLVITLSRGPRGLVVSHRNHIIYVMFFSDWKLLLAL